MKKLEIQKGSENPILRAKSSIVLEFNAQIKKLSVEMKKTLKSENGLGLAAPQVGKNIRMFIMIFNFRKKDETIFTVINPEVEYRSDKTCLDEEGCLSLPGVWGKVERPVEIKVKFYDLNGALLKMTLTDLNAREFLHENDHLDGVLFVDRIKEVL